jgi:hypothetical protein
VTDQAPGPEFKKRKRKRNSNSKLTDCVWEKVFLLFACFCFCFIGDAGQLDYASSQFLTLL